MTTTTYYPVIGCQGTTRDAARPYDARWFLTDVEGNALTSADHAALQTVMADIKFGFLALTAKGMLRLDIMLDVIEDDESVQTIAYLNGSPIKVVDEGELAAAWFENVLGEPCRFVKCLDRSTTAD